MNYIDFSNIGGLPLTQDRLNFLQQSYLSAMVAIAKLCGDKSILYGVEISGGDVSDGWISYNDELLPFVGGAVASKVVIVETPTPYVFEDNNSHDVEFTRYATCASIGDFDFGDLVRIETLSNLEKWLPGDVKMVNCDDAYIAANFDGSGLGINERVGWAIMNGGNGTADWRGKFAVGYHDGDVDYDSMADAGGSKTHVVTKDNIQAFTISKPGSGTTSGIGFPVAGNDNTDGTIDLTVGVASPTPIDHRPPFKVTLYIQKL